MARMWAVYGKGWKPMVERLRGKVSGFRSWRASPEFAQLRHSVHPYGSDLTFPFGSAPW
jgi:hypothetical protein